MTRIKCPHCGAGNRETPQTQTCWQCGKPLWEPVERQTYALDGLPPLAVTTALSPGRAPAAPPHRGLSRRDVGLAALAAVLALLLLAAVALLYLQRRAVPKPSSGRAKSAFLSRLTVSRPTWYGLCTTTDAALSRVAEGPARRCHDNHPERRRGRC